MAPTGAADEVKILTPVGMIGYGFSEKTFWKAIEEGVDAIIADCGSTDSGPQKLAKGTTTVTREAYARDLNLLLAACSAYDVPILLGSAGGDGATAHVQLFLEIIIELIKEKGYRTMNIITIDAEFDKGFIKEKWAKSEVSPCSKAVPPLTMEDIDDATRIVGQMGLEPYMKAMTDYPDFDIIVGGRSYDPAMYAAYCMYRGFDDLGITYHMGKIMECGALCSQPKSKEALAIVRRDNFDIIPLDRGSRCTVLSVAAHTLYEKTRPDILVGPGGELHLENAEYEQLEDGRTVRVSKGRFVPVKEGEYTIKLEGARAGGYRSAFIGAFRDPILISQIDSYLLRVEAFVKAQLAFSYQLKLHTYGLNAVMGPLDPGDGNGLPKEVCICGEAKASTQSEATQVVNLARIACVHGPYPHQLATSGNFAMPFAPYDIPLGEICEFNIYHLLEKADPIGLFPVSYHTVDGNGTFVRGTGDAPKQNGVMALATIQLQEAKTVAVRAKTETPRPFLKPDPPVGHCYLGDIADVVRSKNAGPYELTMDVMFNEEESYQKVKKTGVLSSEMVKKLYHITDDDLIACLFWDQARAFKATITRPITSGSFGDTDVHASQQHIPLLYTLLPLPRS